MIAKTLNIFPTMLKEIVQHDLLILSTNLSDNLDIFTDSVFSNSFSTKSIYFELESVDTFLQMFLTEPHVHILDDEPKIDNLDPKPNNVDLAPQQPRQQTYSSLGVLGYFIIKDIPPQKWNLCFQEFFPWGLCELIKPNTTVQSVLIVFSTRLTCTLKEF